MYDFELTQFLVEYSTTEGEPSANNFPVDVQLRSKSEGN